MIFTYSDGSFSAEKYRCLYTKNEKCNILTIGKRSYVIKADIYVYKDKLCNYSNILIGNYCSISHDIQFLLYANHDYKAVSTYPWYAINEKNDEEEVSQNINECGQIIIGNDVWIGQGCKIMGG